MLNQTFMDCLPLWALCLLTIVLIVLASELGVFMGRRRRRKRAQAGTPGGGDGAVAGITVASMLGLAAFMLGFTFSIAASWVGQRRALVVKESNAIGTAWLRTQMLPEPIGSESRQLYRDYLNVRVEALRDPSTAKLGQAISESGAIQDRLWAQAVLLTQRDRSSPVYAMYVASLNDVIDVHSERLSAGRLRLPWVVWLVLYVIILLSVGALGLCFGLSGNGGPGMSITLAVAFTLVISLVADLDRAAEGVFRSYQRPLIELQQKMNQPAGADSSTSTQPASLPSLSTTG